MTVIYWNPLDRSGDGFRFDMPGPYTLEWSSTTARNRIREKREISRRAIPVVTGVVAVAVPYVIGAGIVAFAPPWMKPIGLSMMIPTGVGDAAWFAAGYYLGTQFESHIPDWML